MQLCGLHHQVWRSRVSGPLLSGRGGLDARHVRPFGCPERTLLPGPPGPRWGQVARGASPSAHGGPAEGCGGSSESCCAANCVATIRWSGFRPAPGSPPARLPPERGPRISSSDRAGARAARRAPGGPLGRRARETSGCGSQNARAGTGDIPGPPGCPGHASTPRASSSTSPASVLSSLRSASAEVAASITRLAVARTTRWSPPDQEVT